MDAGRLNKMRWRCRRGMRELDALLGGYIDSLQGTLPAGKEQALSKLLDSEDDRLWDWLSGREKCPDPDLDAIIDDIRATD